MRRSVRALGVAITAWMLGAGGPAAAQEMELAGVAEVDHFSYLDPAGAEQVGRRQQGLLQLRGTARLHERLELFAEGQLRGHRTEGSKGRAYLNEAYVDLLLPGVDLRVGRQTIVWGKTDVVSPTDHFSPRDFTDPLDTDDERLGVLAARVRGSIGEVRVEGVLAPGAAFSRLPGIGSRWAPAFPASMPHPADPGRTLRASYELAQVADPALRLENAQLGARVSTTARGWDVSLSWFDGWDDLPATVRRVVPVSEEEVRVELRQTPSRKRALGGDLATTVGAYTIRAEGAYLMPDSLGGPDHFQYVVGVERFFGDPLAAGGTQLLAQWIQELTPRGFRPGPFDLNHVFRQAAMARAQRNMTTDLQLSVDGVYDFRTDGYYLQPGASWRLRDGLRIEGTVDLLGGSDEAFFGAFEGNRRLRTSVRYSF
ncbi:MAG TPA: DUF1302 family protein [Longimicrobiaceae bacterium]